MRRINIQIIEVKGLRSWRNMDIKTLSLPCTTPLPTGVVLWTAHSSKLTGTSRLDISSWSSRGTRDCATLCDKLFSYTVSSAFFALVRRVFSQERCLTWQHTSSRDSESDPLSYELSSELVYSGVKTSCIFSFVVAVQSTHSNAVNLCSSFCGTVER